MIAALSFRQAMCRSDSPDQGRSLRSWQRPAASYESRADPPLPDHFLFADNRGAESTVQMAGDQQLEGSKTSCLKAPVVSVPAGQRQKWTVIALNSGYVVPKQETSIKVLGRRIHPARRSRISFDAIPIFS